MNVKHSVVVTTEQLSRKKIRSGSSSEMTVKLTLVSTRSVDGMFRHVGESGSLLVGSGSEFLRWVALDPDLTK
jgi:hypothetical protein